MNSTQNFFDSLYADSDQDDDDENVCLITGETLLNDHITFDLVIINLIILLFLMKFVSKSVNFYQMVSIIIMKLIKLKNIKLNVPYCRKKFDGLLPPPDLKINPNYTQVLFVNFPYSKCIMLDKCKYTFLSGKKKVLLVLNLVMGIIVLSINVL